MIKYLLDIIYPNLCIYCEQRLLHQENHICFSCMLNLPKTNFTNHLENAVNQMFDPYFPLQFGAALLYFKKGSGVQNILHSIKYRNNKSLGMKMGVECGKDLIKSNKVEGIDMIIPVPLHKKKLKSRGYNQTEIIAQGIEERTDISIDTHHLFREGKRKSQTQIGRYARWLNVKQEFVLKKQEELEGKHVLLLDDVLTTGATLLSCLELLKQVKDIKVSVYCLAIAELS